MTDYHFLKHFITEPVYVIGEKGKTTETAIKTQDRTDSKATPDYSPSTSEITNKVQEPALTYETSKKVVVVVNKMNPAEETLLYKILQAVKLDSSGVTIHHMSNEQPPLAEKTICFGVQEGTITQGEALYAPSLSTIATNQDEKKLLWNKLKDLFKL